MTGFSGPLGDMNNADDLSNLLTIMPFGSLQEFRELRAIRNTVLDNHGRNSRSKTWAIY